MLSLFSKILKYVWPQIRKRRWVFYFILFGFSFRVLCGDIIVPIFFKKIIDIFSNTVGDPNTLSHKIFLLFFIITGIRILNFFVARITKFTFLKFEVDVTQDLRNFSFQKIEQNSQTFFSNTFAGSLVTKARRFVGGFNAAFDIFIYNFLKFFVMLAGVFTVLLFQSPIIALVFGIWIIVHVSVVSVFIRKKVSYDLMEAEQDSKISGRLADVFSNILAVKFFSARKREIDSFGKYTDEGAKRSWRASFLGGKIDLLQHLLIISVQSVTLYLMISLWLQDKMSIGTIVLIQAYLVIIADNLWEFGNSLTKFMKSTADMKEMADIFDIIPDIVDPKNPEPLRMNKGHIVFKNIHFKYQMGEEVLSDFNLDIAPGERVGIVGHSGAGKSTITKLLLRFNDITSGAITIDGQDIRNVAQDDLRSVISYVPQEPILFHRPIRENINYGKPNATQEEIIEVAKKAHADEFVSRLPQGYETLVGERGVKLSGGERQRIAIARAMLKDSPILMLDEATSSLDSISESYIQDAFNELMKGKTTIVIAHRLSTIQKMDRIIVLDKGKIVEEGTHKELIKNDGLYADLWNHQTGGFLQ